MLKNRGRLFSYSIFFLISVLFLLLSHEIARAYQEEENHPTPRIYHTMIYHTKADRILLFGGHSKSGWVLSLSRRPRFDLQFRRRHHGRLDSAREQH